MADVKPLKLRTQRAPASVVGATELPVATVLVDTGVFHLAETFDYLIPEKFSSLIQPGVLVKVPFNKAMTQGYVISRTGTSEIEKLRPIEGVISPLPIFTQELQGLLEKVARRYASSIWDVVRSAIPARVATVEKNFVIPGVSVAKGGKPIHEFWALARSPRAISDLISELLKIGSDGSTLIIAPDERDLLALQNELNKQGRADVVVLGTHLEKSVRYSNFLQATFAAPQIILGTRSAIFTPLTQGSRIVLFGEGEESGYEKRNPGWNVRDVALLRAVSSSIIFASYSPSLEVARMVDQGFLVQRFIGKSVSAKFSFSEGRDSHNAVISRGLKLGSVLVTLSAPGYVNSFSCQKCRNIAVCECGGRLNFGSARIPTCSLCTKKFAEWRCNWCGEQKPRAIRRGAERFAEEFGRAFPNISVLMSNGSHPIQDLPEGKHLVLATNGCEPHGEYAAVVLLDGESLFNRSNLRGDEIARKHWAVASSLIQEGGEIFISLPLEHPASQALAGWTLLKGAVREMKERAEAHLPPEYRLAVIEGPTQEIAKVARGIEKLGEAFSQISIPIDALNSRIIARCKVSESANFSDFFFNLARYRSIKGEESLRVRIDPFNF